MKLPSVVRKNFALCLLLASNAASAAVLTLPTPNAPSPDLQSSCGSDPGCQPLAGVPVTSPPGQIADQRMVLTSANGLSNFTSPFAGDSTLDDAFPSPTGNQSTAFPSAPTSGNDATDEFSRDQASMRKMNRRLLQSYQSMPALGSPLDTNQGNRDAGAPVSGQCDEANGGCAARDFLPLLTSLCEASDGVHHTFGLSSQSDCPADIMHVSNYISTSKAELTAYLHSVGNFAKDAVDANQLQSADVRYFSNHAAPKQTWRCSECNVDQTREPEPGWLRQMLMRLKDPVSLLLLTLAVIALLTVDAVVKARRA